ncbi:MAG: hypothetical protein AABZ06_00710 [Bdellovibrionota bacterium]
MSSKQKKEIQKAAKIEKKHTKAKSEEVVSIETPEIQHVDMEELEDQQAEAAAASNQNSNAAAIAAASGNTEVSASFKNFRHHPDMENFYRFIHENDLRHEALAIIDEIMVQKSKNKQVRSAKVHAH